MSLFAVLGVRAPPQTTQGDGNCVFDYFDQQASGDEHNDLTNKSKVESSMLS